MRKEKLSGLTVQWREQQAEARKLEAAIEANLKALGFPLGGECT